MSDQRPVYDDFKGDDLGYYRVLSAWQVREMDRMLVRAGTDQEIYHQVYMVLFNAGTDKYLGALEQAQALVGRLHDAEDAIRRLYGAQYRNGTHGAPPMVSVDAAVWREVGAKFQDVINAWTTIQPVVKP